MIQRPGGTWASLAAPREYQYFEAHQHFPFNAFADGFDTANAWWLAECSLLAYATHSTIEEQCRAAGLKATAILLGGSEAFVAQHRAFVIVAFRGTQTDSLQELLKDALVDTDVKLTGHSPLPGRMHEGFWIALDRIFAKVRQAVGAEAKPLWVTGHSLGGAMAALFAARHGAERVRGLYTFGSPRIGNAAFAQSAALPVNTVRVVHRNDLIPNLPPRPYAHPGSLRYIDGEGRILSYPGPSRLADFLEALPADLLEPGSALVDLREALEATRWLIVPDDDLHMLFSRTGRYLLDRWPNWAGAESLLPRALSDHAMVWYVYHLWRELTRESER